jgi:hypothetical protein
MRTGKSARMTEMKSYHKLGISPWPPLQSKEHEMSLTDRMIAVKPRLPAQ